MSLSSLQVRFQFLLKLFPHPTISASTDQSSFIQRLIPSCTAPEELCYRPLTCKLSFSHFLGGLPGCYNLASFKGCVCILEALPRLLPCTTSHDPDLSQSFSVSQKHCAARSAGRCAQPDKATLCFIQKHRKRGAHPTIFRVTTTSTARRAYLSGWPRLQTGSTGN